MPEERDVQHPLGLVRVRVRVKVRVRGRGRGRVRVRVRVRVRLYAARLEVTQQLLPSRLEAT